MNKPGVFIKWAEDVCFLISTIYETDYDSTTEDLYNAVKEAQGYEDEEDSTD